MSENKILFVLDDVEFQKFGFHDLVTSFWLLKEFCRRNYDTYVTVAKNLFLTGNIPEANVYDGKLLEKDFDIKAELDKTPQRVNLNDFDMIFFRPDPPVNINYIYCTYILDYVDRNNTVIVNDPSGIRKANEKIYINNFKPFVPENITTSNISLIKEFIDDYKRVVVKPLNKCVGKGVFFIEKGDKNTNAILESVTEYGKNCVMVQEYVEAAQSGEKRLTLLGGQLIEEAIMRIPSGKDFRLNITKEMYLRKVKISEEERAMCEALSPYLVKDGIYLAGIDVIGNKLTEINVTSPSFFIKEANKFYNTQLEVKIVDYLESLIPATICPRVPK